jgi:mannose-6-phosphate isomerase
MSLIFSPEVSKDQVFKEIKNELSRQNFTIINNETRPWGGFFVISEEQAERFSDTFFSLNRSEILTGNKLSPKILVVEAGKRLSWQYHYRRAEIWKVIGGNVGVVKSETDDENLLERFDTGDIIRLKQGERHRLVGLESWGIVAEIWQHTHEGHPSDEDDIVRLSDDFGR